MVRLRTRLLATRLLAACVTLGMPVAAMTATPDFTGVWERYPNPVASDSDVFGDIPPPEKGPDLRAPYAAQWKALRAKRAAAAAAGKPLVDDSTRCRPEGMPLVMGAIFPIQILSNAGQVTVLAEFVTQTRRIYIDVPMPTAADYAPSYYGFSSGHWEGDTLVVKTQHVRKDVEFFEIPHSDQMSITERIRMTGADTLEDRIEIDDPAYLQKPYSFTFGYKRNHVYRIMEYFCDQSSDVIDKNGTVSMKVDPARR